MILLEVYETKLQIKEAKLVSQVSLRSDTCSTNTHEARPAHDIAPTRINSSANKFSKPITLDLINLLTPQIPNGAACHLHHRMGKLLKQLVFCLFSDTLTADFQQRSGIKVERLPLRLPLAEYRRDTI